MMLVPTERTGATGANRLAAKVRSALPRGQTLPDDVWRKRHRALVALLCLHAVAISAFAGIQGFGLLHSLADGAVLVAIAGVAYASRRRRRAAAALVSVGLITASALVVHVSGGVIEAHFHFFVMIVVLSLYEDWLAFLGAAAYVVIHHGMTGLVDPHAVYNHPDAIAHPWKWAVIHGAFVAAAGIASVVAWRLNETVRAEARDAEEAQLRLAAIVDSCHEAIIGKTLDGTIVSWNGGAEKIYGYSAEEALGKPITMLAPSSRRHEVSDILARIRCGRRVEQFETVRVGKDGRLIDVALTISPVRNAAGGLIGASTIARDISEQKLRERYLKIQHAATRVLAQTATTREALPALLEAIGQGMGWPVGAFWMPSGENGTELRCKAYWHEPGSSAPVFEAATKRIAMARGTGLPGHVWERRRAHWVPDVTVDPQSKRCEAAAADGLHAMILLPVLSGAEFLGVIEFLSHEIRPPDPALLEMLDTLSAPIAQFLERKHADEQVAHQARHDALTGLPNRRKLVEDLEVAATQATDQRPQLILLLDLDGFKTYNDSLGHAAGDALLARLGRRLAAAIGGRGTSYRMGGDEFCVIAPVAEGTTRTMIETACGALSEEGAFGSVSASCGSALLPVEATTPSEALALADRRMYARKDGGSRASAACQSTDVLLQVLCERSPELGSHVDQVTELCEAVGKALELPEDSLAHLRLAGSLHDLGKTAVPEAILNKRGPLDEEEWSHIRRHTVIGERILAAAPALAPAARLVRSSHERLDGRGYPDGLAGEQIPLGARIIAVCDAFDAMTEDRPYRSAISDECALAELRSCAGTQFDPAVVDVLATVVERDAPVGVC